MSRRVSFKVDFDLDFQFWHLVPSININLHSREIEFEWMCFGIYAGRIKDPPERPKETITFDRKAMIDEIWKDIDFLMKKPKA